MTRAYITVSISAEADLALSREILPSPTNLSSGSARRLDDVTGGDIGAMGHMLDAHD